MRALALVAAAPILLLAGSAKADSFLDIEGGLTTPLGDDDWNNTVESSPKLAVHAGSVPGTVGGMVSVDWTPYNTDAQADFPGTDIAANRFRILANLAFMSPVKAKLMLTGRVGIGADIQHASAEGNIFGVHFETSDTDVGIGFEVAAGLWARVGGVAIGGELALPISHHDQDNQQGDIDFIYDTFDLDLMFGVRLMTDN
ncbi:MAG TPA: hypothetical protein VMZ53_18760 [Kofleriaceae bacterium]|nr:hypothetical protein [Kofleriaceae bacterium]